MIRFYAPTYSSTHDDEYARVAGRVAGSFDLLTFMRGRPFYGAIPSDVRIMLGEGDLGDFISTHVSWKIFSRRAAEIIARTAGDAVQFFDAPLFRATTGSRVDGYQIINATRAIYCIDLSRADVSYREDSPEKIDRVHRWAFDGSAIPNDLHVFRPAEYLPAICFSKKLTEEMMSAEPAFEDLGFVEYGGDEGARTIRRGREGATDK